MKNTTIRLIFIFLSIVLVQSCSLLQQNTNMKVVTIKKVIDKSAPDHEICSSLNVTKEDVVLYFSTAKQVDGYVFNHQAIILPCKYKGTINIDGDLLEWEIIAGGAGYLYNDKSINKRYLCIEKCLNALPNLR